MKATRFSLKDFLEAKEAEYTKKPKDALVDTSQNK
jgi:hypothetical protein